MKETMKELAISGQTSATQGNASRENSPLANQVGGERYKYIASTSLEYCHANNIGKIEGDVIAYVSRWRAKNGLEDLRKAIHELEILIELEERKGKISPRAEAGECLGASPHPAIPEGWALVPVEPTEEMIKAMEGQWIVGSQVDMAKREYRAALAAAKEPK